MSKAVIIITGCEIQGTRNSETKDSKGRLESVRTYANLAWMGGSMNVELDPTIVDIPEHVPLTVNIESDLTDAFQKFGKDERRCVMANPRRLVKFVPVSAPASSAPPAAPGLPHLGDSKKGSFSSVK